MPYLESHHPDMFAAGTFTDSADRLLSVAKTVRWAASHAPATEVPVAKFVRDLEDGHTDTIDKFGSDGWKERAGRADASFPILVLVDDNGEQYIGDGNHRCWKTHMAGKKTILAHVVRERDIPDSCLADQ